VKWIDRNAELFLNLIGLAIIVVIVGVAFLLGGCSSIEISDDEILASIIEACNTEEIICKQ